MNDEASIDVVRLIRVLAFGGALVAALTVYLAAEPSLAAVNARLERARAVLRADGEAFAEADAVRLDRDRLARRYAPALGKAVDADFVRAVDADARRHRIDVLETTTERHADASGALAGVDVVLSLGGRYRDLLACIADVSRADTLVGVRSASLRRDDGRIVASIRLTLFEPDSSESPRPPTKEGSK